MDDVFTLLVGALACAIARTLKKPESFALERERMRGRIEIIKKRQRCRTRRRTPQMKKRWTALLLALAMLSALAVGALADEQDKEKTAAEETAQTAPDAAGTLSFENLGARMRTGNYTLLSLEENIAAIECLDLRQNVRGPARRPPTVSPPPSGGLIQMGQGESYNL